jgi:hypothetical protein
MPSYKDTLFHGSIENTRSNVRDVTFFLSFAPDKKGWPSLRTIKPELELLRLYYGFLTCLKNMWMT